MTAVEGLECYHILQGKTKWQLVTMRHHARMSSMRSMLTLKADIILLTSKVSTCFKRASIITIRQKGTVTCLNIVEINLFERLVTTHVISYFTHYNLFTATINQRRLISHWLSNLHWTTWTIRTHTSDLSSTITRCSIPASPLNVLLTLGNWVSAHLYTTGSSTFSADHNR